MGLSFSHIFFVLVVVFIVFGAGRLPQVMQELGRGYRAFRKAMDGEDDQRSKDDFH